MPLRRTPLTKVSRKRARQLREYSVLRAEFLARFPRCQYPGGCTALSTDVHHMRGRVGADLLDVDHWLALCRPHHEHITTHPAEALALGVSERRIGRGAA